MASVFKKQGRRNWTISYFDHTGHRREKSSGTTDKRAAERIANKFETDVALRRAGVIDPQQEQFASHSRTAISDHVTAYLASCEKAGQSSKNIVEKRRHLERLLAETGVTRLSDLSADILQGNMYEMQVERCHGRNAETGEPIIEHEPAAARTKNFRRQAAVAFLNWCVKTGRCERNPLAFVAQLDERNDRRRVRRSLTDNELSRLFRVAAERGRLAWYLAAFLAGLRKGDLQRLRWQDINFAAGSITIADGKAKREDIIPLHRELADVLKRLRPPLAHPHANVFPQTVTDRTRRRDFERAEIAEQDTEGRVADLHCLRTTLGTKLARAGVAPQIAQRIMRHSDYKTTLKHYTVLGLTDTAGAIASLPGVLSSESETATGTLGRVGPDDCQRLRQQ